MRPSLLLSLSAVFGLAALASLPAGATVTANGLFSDHAVLQQGRKIPVFGSAADGEKVVVRLGNQSAATTAKNGAWRVDLKPMKAGGPYTLTIAGPSNTITVQDVLVGEVWVCSGQSNMSFTLSGAATGAQAIAQANDPLLHVYHVPNIPAATPQTEVGGQWQVSSPQTAGGFSAVAYFFGRDLRKSLGVPVGLIVSEWGGTPAQSWTSGEALKTLPDFRPAVEAFDQQRKDPSAFLSKAEAWYAKYDAGSTGKTWADPDFDDTAWKSLNQPVAWSQSGVPDLAGPYLGTVWFRKAVGVPAAWAGKDLTLLLGPIDDADTTYFNGVRVGGLGNWQQNRDYTVPSALVKPSKNVIAIRVLNTSGDGGIYGKPEQLALEATGATAPISLSGPWQWQVGGPLPANDPAPSGNGIDAFTTPGGLYNGMIAPLIPYGIQGAIWYQGEANAGDPIQYRTLLPTMIGDWRARWAEGNFPFYLVQLAPFMSIVPDPQDSGWALLRESQRQITLAVPNTGEAVITDSGDQGNIHPTRKEPVGDRLALDALALTYHQPVEYSGPAYASMTVDAGKVILRFTHADGLHAAAVLDADGKQVAPPDTLTGFAIAGADGKYVNADAVIQGSAVVVSSPAVPQPQSVRYGWANYPLVNLYNKAGLPASPFQTDPFPVKKAQ